MKLRKLSNMLPEGLRSKVANNLANSAEVYLNEARLNINRIDRKNEYLATGIILQAAANFMVPDEFEEPKAYKPPKPRKKKRTKWVERRFVNNCGPYYYLRFLDPDTGKKRTKYLGKKRPLKKDLEALGVTP